MARAPALQAGGRGFEPHILHEGRGCFRAAGSLTCWEESEIIERRETRRVESGFGEPYGVALDP